MTVVRKFKIPNRLRAALFTGDGKRIDEAVADAETGLATLVEACLAAVAESIARIEGEFGAQVAGRETHEMVDLYRLSTSIIDACAPIEPKALADAARSLCDLLDHGMEAGRWDWPAVDIHIDALKLLASGIDLGKGGEEQLILSLEKLRQHREAVAG
jgi:hypothetical protein